MSDAERVLRSASERPGGHADRDDRSEPFVVGVLVRRLQHAHDVAWAAHVDATLSGLEYTVLRTISEQPRIEQGILAARVSLQRSTMADVGRRLEQRGLISRRVNPQDARSKLLELTVRGRSTLQDVDDRVPALAAALLADDEEDLSSLLRRLEDLADRWDVLGLPIEPEPAGGIVSPRP